MKTENRPNWKIVLIGIFVIAIMVAATYLAANYLGKEEDVSPEDTSAYDVEPIIKSYEYNGIYTFGYDSSVWTFLSEDKDLGSKFEYLKNGGVLTISIYETEMTLDELYIQEKNSVSNISSEISFLEEKQIQKGSRTYYKVIFESKLLGSESVRKQVRVLTLVDDQLVKFVYVLPAGEDGDFVEVDSVISNIVFN